ncbi:uncharacterized protein [Dermacentor albipictus]|uniref:uncharacterized protein isoform X2 n=1 Tax=Dermacentor albipictus TaxID=60249 RepID=UPI0031FCA830
MPPVCTIFPTSILIQKKKDNGAKGCAVVTDSSSPQGPTKVSACVSAVLVALPRRRVGFQLAGPGGARETKAAEQQKQKARTMTGSEKRPRQKKEVGFCSFGGRCSFIHTKRETADIVNDVLNNMRLAPPMPENPVTAAASASSSTGGSRSSTPASWSSCDQGDNAQSSVADTGGGGGETAAALGDESPPPTKKRKRRAQGKKNASLDPRWNPGTWKRDESDLPPLALEPSLLDAPLEPDFRRRWTYRWRDMPYRRLDVFEQLCPRDG